MCAVEFVWLKVKELSECGLSGDIYENCVAVLLIFGVKRNEMLYGLIQFSGRMGGPGHHRFVC